MLLLRRSIKGHPNLTIQREQQPPTVGLSVILTGFHVYQKIVKFGGAGALVPITGFANSVVSPAIEYKAEGHVFGIGCKIFTIAGPVILYGILASWVLGMVKYFWRYL